MAMQRIAKAVNCPTPLLLLQWQDRQLTLRDLGSRNGTRVNGEKLETLPHQPYSDVVVLQLGSRIQFGNLEFEVINSHE